MRSLAIIVVNWNAGQQLQACITSLGQAIFPDDVAPEIIVVDNDSSDGSQDFLVNHESTGMPTRLLSTGSNLGFGNACNFGFRDYVERHDVPDFVLFLNPDTEVFPDTFVKLFECSDLEEKSFGIYGVQLLDDEGITQSSSRFPTAFNFWMKLSGLRIMFPGWPAAHHHMTYFDHRADRTVDQVMGAFYLVRGPLFNELQGFDPAYFVYFEEVDFAYRARQLGHRTRFLAGPSIYHRGNGTTERVKAFRQYLSVSSRITFFAKHRGLASTAVVLLATFFLEMPIRVISNLLKGDPGESVAMLRAHLRVLSNRGAQVRHPAGLTARGTFPSSESR